MSDIFGIAQQQSLSRVTDGNRAAVRLTRDGSVINLPWFQALVLEGRVFQAAGPDGFTAFTPLTLLALASFGDDDKTLFVDIPDGTAAIPLSCDVNFQATGAAIVHAVGFTADALNGTGGTETAITQKNLRRDSPVASAATCAHTADTEADVVTGVEVQLFQYRTAQDLDGVALAPGYRWDAFRSGFSPVVLDAGSININMAPTTSGTGWAVSVWAELPESAIT